MDSINEAERRICSWGILLAEAYGVHLPAGYAGFVPLQMRLMDVAKGTGLYSSACRLTLIRKMPWSKQGLSEQ